MTYKVSDIAELAGISVRTLHHYDRIGLLKPSQLSGTGYRLYQESDLEKLQHILFYKELGFSLNEIKEILDNPAFDRQEALIQHKRLLTERKERLERMIAALEHTINQTGGVLQMDKMFGGFQDTESKRKMKKYAEEARRKYSKESVDESERRTASYSKDDWKGITEKQHEIYGRMAAAMDQGPASAAALAAAAEWRQFITNHFYECTPEIFRGLADLYVEDERFTASIDAYKPGLAAFFSEAVIYYCTGLN